MAIINGPYPAFSCALHGVFVTAQMSVTAALRRSFEIQAVVKSCSLSFFDMVFNDE